MKVSILIVARNEERYLKECLQSVQSQTYPHNLLEVILVDSASEDSTARIMKEFIQSTDIPAKMFENPNGDTPNGLNIGISHCSGELIKLMIAHSFMPPDHIERAVEILKQKNADGVSSRIVSIGSGKGSLLDVAIATAMESPFGIGNAHARVSNNPGWIDNPMLCLYKRELFDKYGLMDKRLTRNQDYEFNQRCFSGGAKFWFQPDLELYYHNRPSIKALWRQYFDSARWRAFMIGQHIRAVRPRHLVPSIFVLALLCAIIITPFWQYGKYALAFVLIPYIVLLEIVAIRESIKRKTFLILMLNIVFPTIHFAYGIGFILGFVHFLILGNKKKVILAEKQ